MSVNVDVSDVAIESSAWCGTRDSRVDKEMTFEQVKRVKGMQVVEYNGRCMVSLILP